jgi:cytochrome c oxidase subunit 2
MLDYSLSAGVHQGAPSCGHEKRKAGRLDPKITEWRKSNYAVSKTFKYIVALVLACIVFGTLALHSQEGVHTIEIHAKRFAFSPNEITLKKGEKVTLALTSGDVSHSLVIPDLGMNSLIKKGHTTTVIITPDKAGTFEGRCGTFCGGGHGSMTFTVHVTE